MVTTATAAPGVPCVLVVAVAMAWGCQSRRSDGGDAPRSGDPSAAEMVLVGRFDRSTPSAPRFAWSGSAITTRFVGTSMAIELEESGPGHRYQITIDGQIAPTKLATTTGRRRYPVAQGLADSAHEVTVYRLTEAVLGETQLHAIALDGDAVPTLVPSPRTRRIELIGDSISAGYGNQGADQHCPFSADTENHYLTWGALAARAVDADLVTVAWSGKGVFSNRGSTTDRLTMPVLWTRTLPDRDDSRWDFAGYRPDAVVINLGANDFAPEVADWSPFAAAYLAFVRDIRARYPDATILCALGPTLSDAWPEGRRALSTARAGIQAAVTALADGGDRAIGFVELATQDGSTGYGCDWHPSLATHARMAATLEAALRDRLGW